MDGSRFDALVQQLHGRGNRRSTLGFLSALGLGIGFAPAERGAARKKRKKCKDQTKKCGKRCIPKGECCGGCGSGLTCCEGTCFDLTTSGANCGVCGNACRTNRCVNGACECQGIGDCPSACRCALAFPSQAGTFCAAEQITATTCDGFEDCPPRTVCRQTLAGNFCGTPCLG
jgi:hypothetical protein